MNRLAKEKSLYLRQHAENPVDWFPWGDEAFAKAKAEDKPIIISIGYSACHWCHVMAHESFEDDYIAKLMNKHFVCIKVDREERPDVDKIYMEAVQMFNGQGGWPLNVFCLPDGRPFAGGTYFPPDERRGHQIVAWPQLLMRVADFYKRQKQDLVENAEAIIGNLKATNAPLHATGDPIENEAFFRAAAELLDRHDSEFGGFGEAPKFPPTMALDFLLGMRASATVDLMNPELCEQIDSCINRTLTGMAHGGIFDQIGGGFSRYSVDRHWLIPHFEKMLYDNGLLLDSYAKASLRFPKPLYRAVAEETIEWLTREMQAPNGAFYAALDADSEGEEGKFYVWTEAEVKRLLGNDVGAKFCHAYGITPEGNFENSGASNPTLLEAEFEDRQRWEPARQQLLAERLKRVAPGRDEKLLTAWNALLVRGLARSAFAFNRPDWFATAMRVAEWIWREMRFDETRLHSVAYLDENGETTLPSGNGLLEDYAYTAEAFLALAESAELFCYPAQPWIDRSRLLADSVFKYFYDPSAVGFFTTSNDHEQLVHRKKEWFDNAVPSGNSTMVNVCSMLSSLTNEARYTKELERLRIAYPGMATRAPAAICHTLSSLVNNAIGIAVIKVKGIDNLKPLHEALLKRPWRPVFILRTEEKNQPIGFQLCVGQQCLEPTTSPESVAELL